jgi:hypothetical protein
MREKRSVFEPEIVAAFFVDYNCLSQGDVGMVNTLRSCALTLFITVCFLVFTTATVAIEDTHTKDFSLNACLGTSSRTVFESPPVGSDGHWGGTLVFAQSNSSCPCFSLTSLMSTTWNRCTARSGEGYPRLLRRLVGDPPSEIWTVQINKLRASCECQSTPSGLCAGKGERGSEIHHSGMSNSEWEACADIIKRVADAQGLPCK